MSLIFIRKCHLIPSHSLHLAELVHATILTLVPKITAKGPGNGAFVVIEFGDFRL